MTGRQEYAYGTGDGTVHDGGVLKHGGCHGGHPRTTTPDREAGEFPGTAVFEKQIGK